MNTKSKIDPRQIKKIHSLVKALGMEDDAYRGRLMYEFRVESCKDLTYRQAQDFIVRLENFAVGCGVWKKKTGYGRRASGIRPKAKAVSPKPEAGSPTPKKYDDLGRRSGMATPKQLRMVEAMWKDVSTVADDKAREKALREFLENRFGVSDIKFLSIYQVDPVINALKKMQERIVYLEPIRK